MNQQMNQQEELMQRLRSVEMDVTVRFGTTELPLREVAELGGGSMIELNKTVDEPVELLINNNPFARGEVVVVDGYYSVRITEVSPPEKVSNTFMAGASPSAEAEEVHSVKSVQADPEAPEVVDEDAGSDAQNDVETESSDSSEPVPDDGESQSANHEIGD